MKQEKFDIAAAAEMTLALMALGIHDETEFDGQKTARTWKGFDWSVLDYLHEQGYIGDSVSKATPRNLSLS
ncbi:MAG: hypothetical protein GWP14_09515 [Actinobacteria bacterium]|nr:hypothetical protein [Actinomycetota bacterium]